MAARKLPGNNSVARSISSIIANNTYIFDFSQQYFVAAGGMLDLPQQQCGGNVYGGARPPFVAG
jgi:hypothetical protein